MSMIVTNLTTEQENLLKELLQTGFDNCPNTIHGDMKALEIGILTAELGFLKEAQQMSNDVKNDPAKTF